MNIVSIKDNQEGFTIIELMIATSIFTIIILFVAVTTTGIGSLYQKGINQSLIQDNVQNISAEITQHIQLADSYRTSAAGNPMAYCFGNVKYSVYSNKKLGTGPTDSKYVVWREYIDGTAPCDPPISNTAVALTASKNSPTLRGTELISNNSRITSFNILSTPTPPPFFFAISEAYGDNDLLEPAAGGYDTHCKGDIGQQFCSTARLTTAVTQRL